jgi:hypothetical protein
VTRSSGPLDLLFFATAFSVTFEQLHWNVAGNVSLTDVLALLFVLAYWLGRTGLPRRPVPSTAATLSVFLGVFVLVYLVGFYNLDTSQAEDQWLKGLLKFLIHFVFLIAGVIYLARRSARFYWRTLAFFTAGLVANAAYGVLQLLAAKSGHNLDNLVLSPLTGGASTINIYGRVAQTQVIYRPQALTGDPNHLAIMLDVPLLVLTPIYLRLEAAHRWRIRLALTLAFLLLVELATLSRSGLLGLGVGTLVLLAPYRRRFLSTRLLAPLGGVVLLVGALVVRRLHFFSTVVGTRVQTGGSSTSAHFGVYSFIPKILGSHPLFGLGLNNFSVYYQQITGKTNWGPHSFYVALIVETGLVGSAAFAVFLWYAFRRLRSTRRLGRMLSVAGDPAAARVRPLAWGLTAALAGTMAANVFYLTMTFYYFYFLLLLLLAAPIVFSRAHTAAASLPAVAPAEAQKGREAIAPQPMTHSGQQQTALIGGRFITLPSRALAGATMLALLVATSVAFVITETRKLTPAPLTDTTIDKLFSPRCRCERRTARIGFRLTSGDLLTLDVLDHRGRLVRTLVDRQAHRAGPTRFRWNGRDNAGRVARDGSYRIQVSLANQQRTLLLPNIIRLDATPPGLHLLSLGPRNIRPGGHPRAIVVRYRNSEPAFALIYIDGRLAVRSRFPRTRGELRWYGRAPSGRILIGQHRIRLGATDLAGNRSSLTPPQTIKVR